MPGRVLFWGLEMRDHGRSGDTVGHPNRSLIVRKALLGVKANLVGSLSDLILKRTVVERLSPKTKPGADAVDRGADLALEQVGRE